MKLWRRILMIGLPLVLLAGIGSGILYLRSDSFQEYARGSLIARIEKATGLSCRVDHLRLDLFRGNFLISGLTLSARPGAPSTVNLNVREIGASLSVSSFWHLRVRLGKLNIVQPHIELVSGPGESSWNPEQILNTLKISLRLEASKVTIQDGWFKVNDRLSPFHLSLNDLDCEIRYSKELPSYKVRLQYEQGRIFWEARDILHGLELTTSVSLEGVAIDSFKLRHGSTLFSGSGSFKNWNSPVLMIHAEGVLDARDLTLAHPSLFEGRGKLLVVTDLRNDARGIYSKGKFTARAGGYRKMDFSSLAGTYELDHDVLHLRSVTGRIADGNFLLNAEIQLREANKDPNRVLVTTRNVPVIDAGRLLNLPLMDFSNTADAETKLTWYGGKELRADCDATLHGLTQPAAASEKSTLLEGKVRFTYFDSGIMDIEAADLRSPYTSVQASGGRGSIFHVQLSTTRISEPYDLIAGFSPPVADMARREPDIREMSGTFDFDGDVKVQSSSDIEYVGKISIGNGRWRSYKVDDLSTQAVFRSPDLKLRSLAIHSGAAAVDGELDLSIADDNRISSFGFKGNARRVPLSMLSDFGADTTKLKGYLSGSGSMNLDHDSWQGEGQFSIESGEYEGTHLFDDLRAQVSLKNQKLHLIRTEARRGAARMNAEGEINLDSRQLRVETRVQNLSIESIPAAQKRGLPVHGEVSASGILRGTIENPAFAGDFDVAALRYDSWKIGHGKGRIQFENSTIRGDARIQSDFGNLAINANLSTKRGYPGKTILEFENLDIQKIIPAKLPPYLKDVSTALEGKLEAEGNFDDLESVRIRGEVDGAHFKIHEYELHNAERMRFTILNRNLRMESVRFVGDGTSVFLSGTVPFDENPRLDVGLSGNLNLQLLEGIEKKLHTTGTVALNIRASGSRRSPQIIGQASFRDTKLDYKDFPFRFSAMQGDIVFSRNLVRFENVSGSANPGTIQLSGILEHQDAELRSVNMNIALRNARLPYPKDFKSLADANLVLSGSGDVQVLSGDVHVTRMEYVRSFDLLEQLASHSTPSYGPLTTEPYLLGLRLNIEIYSDNGLSIDNELTRLRGSMRLTLRGTPAYPSLTGRVEAGEGMIFFRGSRFEIAHASADFIDRNRINPILEIRAEADVKTYRLILDAVGELDHLNLNITSDPPMSTVDILSLLTTGKESETSSATSQRESQMAGMSAASVLSQNLTGVIGKRVQRIFGLESFRVDPFLAGAENDPTARITISERLSKDLVVTFSRNLTTNQEQIVVIEYDVGKNLSVVATRDENGKFGLDFRFRKRLR